MRRAAAAHAWGAWKFIPASESLATALFARCFIVSALTMRCCERRDWRLVCMGSLSARRRRAWVVMRLPVFIHQRCAMVERAVIGI